MSAFPTALQQALAAPAVSGSLNDVAHVVILTEENRSFDHYFGSLSGVRGFGDRVPVRLGNGNPTFAQPDGTSSIYPFRLDTTKTKSQCMTDVDHTWETSHSAWDSGKYDAWVPAKGELAMGYFTRADLPFHYALADAFTICDGYHSSLIGPTHPNRLYLMTGMIDPNGTGGGPAIDNSGSSYTWTTYPERLQAAGVSWKVYLETNTFGDNALGYFTQFRTAPTTSPLYQRGMTQTTDTLAAFAADVANGTLPQVSWIVAPGPKTEHPPFAPAVGADYTAQLLNILASHPDVWAKTVFLLNYDENDGIFDHVVPPTPPAGTPDEFVSGAPIGLGSRVPMIAISPWSRGGWVCSQTFDHTSVIRFLETWTGVHEPNISAWRRSVCGDLTSAFDFTAANTTFPTLPATAPLVSAAATQCSTLPAPVAPVPGAMPTQETGTKSARALPWQPNAAGRSDAVAGKFYVDFANTGTAATTFTAYTTAFRTFAAWQYTVAGSGTFSDYWSAQKYGAGKYSLDVHGPNGFLRTFVGDLNTIASTTKPHLEVKATYDLTLVRLVLTMTNTGTAPAAVTIAANNYRTDGPWTYQLAAGATVTDSWATHNGWYDLTATANVGDGFARRMAGHIENGVASKTG